METTTKISFFEKVKTYYNKEKQKKGRKVLFGTLWSLLFSFTIAFILIASVGVNPFWYFAESFNQALKNQSKMLLYISFFALSTIGIALCFKIGFFNLSVSSQLLLSGIVMLIVTQSMNFSGSSFLLALLVAILISSSISIIVACLKVFFRINEVVSSIMINWMILYVVSFIRNQVTTIQDPINSDGTIAFEFPDFMYSSWWAYLVISLVILVAISIWATLKFTKIGYKINVIGNNKEAAKYSGVNENLYIILIMAFSGVLSGFSAFLFYYIKGSIVIGSQPLTEGFDTITVTLIANNNIIGVLFSSTLYSFLKFTADPMADLTFTDMKYFSDIILGIIIYGAAIITLFMRFNLFKRTKNHFILWSNWSKYKYIRKDKWNNNKLFIKSYFLVNSNKKKEAKKIKNEVKGVHQTFDNKIKNLENKLFSKSIEGMKKYQSQLEPKVKKENKFQETLNYLENILYSNNIKYQLQLELKIQENPKNKLKQKWHLMKLKQKLFLTIKTQKIDINFLNNEDKHFYFEELKKYKKEKDIDLSKIGFFNLDDNKNKIISEYKNRKKELIEKQNVIIENNQFHLLKLNKKEGK